MRLPTLLDRRLTGVAVIACAAALIPVTIPVTASAATAASAATVGRPATLGRPATPGRPAMPAGFAPASASFVSADRGVLLGGTGCTLRRGCTVRLAATSDGGARWHSLSAPRIRIAGPAGAVSTVLFASRRDGWLYDQYGPGLWATHDGGARWRKLSLRGSIESMAASAGIVYAIVTRHAGDELLRSPVGTNAWVRAGTMRAGPGQAVLAVSGMAAWFGTSTYLWATAEGAHWRKYPLSCPQGYGLTGIAAASPAQLKFLCADGLGMFQTDKTVLRSAPGNAGLAERVAGQAPVAGDPNGGFAVPPGRAAVVAMSVITPGLSYVYRSADGGKTWAEIAIPGTAGGVSLNSLSFVSRTAGWLVVGVPSSPGPHKLLRTSDAGRTWLPVRF
jgi:photosystem II stability/assembly factor-like uncharacterized protein